MTTPSHHSILPYAPVFSLHSLCTKSHTPILTSADSNRASPTRQLRARTRIIRIRKRLGNHKHILLKVPELIPLAGPKVKVITRIDRPADRPNLLLRLGAHAKVLREGARALDRRLVDALRSVESVVAAVGRVVAAKCPGLAGREHVPAFDDVVFDERVAGPAVEGEVAGAFGVVLPGVADGPGERC